MKLIFMGSPAFALPALEALIASNHEIICAYTQPPRPAGRGKKLTPTAVHTRAEAAGIEVRHPARLKDEALNELLATPCDAIVVVAYGLLLPQAVLNHAPCINIHPSALPRWRGPAPLQHTLLAGDETSEVCIMQLELGMDTGPVYSRTPLPFTENTTLGELHDTAANIGATALLNVLKNWPQTPTPQPLAGVTLAPKITKEMRAIDWRKPTIDIHNHIRGMSPFPAATATYNGETWKILRSQIVPGSGQPGEILSANGTLIIACGTGAVRILELQRPGKQAQTVDEFLKGVPLTAGACFS